MYDENNRQDKKFGGTADKNRIEMNTCRRRVAAWWAKSWAVCSPEPEVRCSWAISNASAASGAGDAGTQDCQDDHQNNGEGQFTRENARLSVCQDDHKTTRKDDSQEKYTRVLCMHAQRRTSKDNSRWKWRALDAAHVYMYMYIG